MKKITRISALALAFVMAFALQAPDNAAEKAAVNQEKHRQPYRQAHLHTESSHYIIILQRKKHL